MCSAVRRRMFENGTTVSRGPDATDTTGAGAGAGAAGATPVDSMTAWTSASVMRPPAPVPSIVAGSMPWSAISRRTTGDSRRWSPDASSPRPSVSLTGATRADGAACSAGAAMLVPPATMVDDGASLAGCGAGVASGDVETWGGGAGSRARAGAGSAAGTAPASPMRASTVPTSTVPPSCTRISLSNPAAGDGTSESTLSVETSKRGSFSATWSPTSLNQRVIVPSVTVSPSWGIVISAIVISAIGSGGPSWMSTDVKASSAAWRRRTGRRRSPSALRAQPVMTSAAFTICSGRRSKHP